MHLIALREIIRDAEVAYAIGPIIRKHHLTLDDTSAALTACGVARRPHSSKRRFKPSQLHQLVRYLGYFGSVHFLRDKMEDFRLKFFGNKLRALSGAERRVLDTVLIHNTAQG
ncbi:unnamed protein product [uncultured bacterium]|nr:unnamed protein product [uncultured bacterium]